MSNNLVSDNLDKRLRELDVWRITHVESERLWEITTFERSPGKHWHGRGHTLLAALDDLEHWQKQYPDGC